MPFKKISVKIFVVIFLGIFIILASVSFFSFLFTKKILEKSIIESQLEEVRQNMDKIDRLLDARCTDILVIAGVKPVEVFLAPEVGDNLLILEKNASKRMAEIVALTGPWDLLVVTDKSGKIVLSSDKDEIGTFIQKNPQGGTAYEKALTKDLYYSDLALAGLGGRPSLVFSAPVKNTSAPGRPVIGTVVGYFSWPAVLQILEDIPESAVLLNQEGLVIGANASFLEANPSTDQLTDQELISNLQNKRSASIIFSNTEDRVQGTVLASLGVQSGYLSYRGNGWGLILEQPSQVAFASATKTALQLILILTPIIILTSIPIFVMILRWVTYPIAVLTQTTRQIAAGDLTRKVAITSHDEMGELAISFNTMTEKLNQMHENLEQQVKDRTGELVKANQALLQSEKMSAVGQLAAGVAHEINNPLGVILGFAQGVVKRLEPNHPMEMPLKSIEREALRCKDLVQNLLTFSRSSKAGKEETDVNLVTENSLSLIVAQAKVKNIQLVKQLEPGLPKFLANASQIQQILVNLANNAMDAMPGGGTLTFRTKKSQLEGKEAIEIQIQDTGQGIPKEIVSKIFEPFFTTKEIGKGTGLGLSLVFEIVQKHEGKITVDSEIEKGTTFKVCLPLQSQL